jgi:RNA recognition motif-containing protein
MYIFVGNLDPSVTEEMLTDLFCQFGEETKKHESYARPFLCVLTS